MSPLVWLQCTLYIFIAATPIIGQTLNRSLFDETTIDAIKKEGYAAEEHTVTTEDGYILKFQRIPGNASSIPVFLYHGLFSSSFEWVIADKETNLAFFLADRGYDVWMGNSRGNIYCRNHTKYDPSEQRFWDFTWHEMGFYDLPAMIDYITDLKNQKLIYIGHSLGSTVFFVMASERPEMANKVKAGFALGPPIFFHHSKSPLRLLSPLGPSLKKLLDSLGIYEIFPPPIKKVIQAVIKYFCLDTKIENNNHVCAQFLIAVAEDSPSRFNYKLIPRIAVHETEGTSTKTPLHFLQILGHGDFRKYDYGAVKNLKIYNSYTPPAYNLSKIRIPIGIFWAEKDTSYNSALDIKKLYNSIPNKLFNYKVPNPLFSHFDFGVGIDVVEYVYVKLLSDMQQLYR